MNSPRLFLASALFFAVALAAGAQTTSELYTQAQRAYMAGDVETAKAKFNEVLLANPDHQPSKNYLKMIAASSKGNQGVLEKKLGGITLEKISFKEASLSSVLDYLKNQLAVASNKEIQTSFVLQLPPEFAEQQKVTLELSKVPFTEVLRYIGALTNTKFSIEEYAIVVRPA